MKVQLSVYEYRKHRNLQREILVTQLEKKQTRTHRPTGVNCEATNHMSIWNKLAKSGTLNPSEVNRWVDGMINDD